ncbi:TPA: CHAD domain-containing protein [bacterium]|nr:CHAD domain-containing protein [bacterium]
MISIQIKIKEIKPALVGYITESLRLLKSNQFPNEDAVHDIRVLMKKSRAAIKLISSQVESDFYSREYGTFRDAGRILASWRETSVQRKTLKAVRKSYKELFERLAEDSRLKEIMKKPELSADNDSVVKKKISELENILRRSLYRIRFYNLKSLKTLYLLQELEKTFIKLSELYLYCRNNPKPAKLHTLRKRTKDFLYQLYFFRPLNPQVVKKIEKRLDGLAQNLGKYNDITQIIDALGYRYGNAENSPELDELIVVLKGIQDQHLIKVWPIAYKLFRPGQNLQDLIGISNTQV